MLLRCRGPEFKGMESESPHGKKEIAGEGKERKMHTKDALWVCGCWLEYWNTLRFQCLAKIAKTGGRYGKRQLKLCVPWSWEVPSGNTIRARSFASLFVHDPGQSECEELQRGPTSRGVYPKSQALSFSLFSLSTFES